MALNAIIHRTRRSWWQRFLEAPNFVLAKTLYAIRQHTLRQRSYDDEALNINVVCISDTHNSQPKLPPGDILIHAGDLTQTGTIEELQLQLDWINDQPHEHKIVIAGNHDIALDENVAARVGVSPADRESLRWGSIIYLQRSGTTLEFPERGQRVTLFGHPSTRVHGSFAFQYKKGIDVFSHSIPSNNIDILITHSPPKYHLDLAGWGDEFLLRELWRVKPRLHVFGHLHEEYGKEILIYDWFEALFERVCAGTAGVRALVSMVGILVRARYFGSGEERRVRRTMLVNAAAVGGVLDRGGRKVQVVRL